MTINGLNATAVFAGAGLAYLATALYFQVPVPVQPLKAFAAAAIALELDATTIAAGGQEKYLEGFGPKAPGFYQVPFGDIAAVKEAITEETAAILIEPVQGEGGIRVVSNELR